MGVFKAALSLNNYLLLLTLSILLYHLGRRGEKELSVSGKLDSLAGWNVVGLQGIFHTLYPGLPLALYPSVLLSFLLLLMSEHTVQCIYSLTLNLGYLFMICSMFWILALERRG